MIVMRMECFFEELCWILSDGSTMPDGTAGFGDMCLSIGADRVLMDNLFYERFGMSGEDVMIALGRKK